MQSYPFENRDSLFREPNWVKNIVVKNRFEEVIFVVGLERRLSRHHFVHENTQSPPVNCSSIGQLLKDLFKNKLKLR